MDIWYHIQKMPITLSEKEYVDNVQKYIQKGMPRKVDAATLWEMAGQGRYLFWSMIYTNDEERKAGKRHER